MLAQTSDTVANCSGWDEKKNLNHDHTVTVGSNNLIIILMVAKQFPVNSSVIYCTLHANGGPHTLCLFNHYNWLHAAAAQQQMYTFAEDALAFQHFLFLTSSTRKSHQHFYQYDTVRTD